MVHAKNYETLSIHFVEVTHRKLWPFSPGQGVMYNHSRNTVWGGRASRASMARPLS